MRIIVDQQLPPVLASWFRDHGIDAAHVRDLGMAGAADTTIWAEATKDDAVVISRDEDFVALVRSGGAVGLDTGGKLHQHDLAQSDRNELAFYSPASGGG